MLGDGAIQGNPTASNHISRCQPSTGITVTSAPRCNSLSPYRANSPMVIPCRKGIWSIPLKDVS